MPVTGRRCPGLPGILRIGPQTMGLGAQNLPHPPGPGHVGPRNELRGSQSRSFGDCARTRPAPPNTAEGWRIIAVPQEAGSSAPFYRQGNQGPAGDLR